MFRLRAGRLDVKLFVCRYVHFHSDLRKPSVCTCQCCAPLCIKVLRHRIVFISSSSFLKRIHIRIETDHCSLAIRWADQHVSEFPFVWLRDNCSCPACVDKHTYQRNLDTVKEVRQWTVKIASLIHYLFFVFFLNSCRFVTFQDEIRLFA